VVAPLTTTVTIASRAVSSLLSSRMNE